MSQATERSEPETAVALHKQLSEIWDTAPGWGRFSALNHTVIGKRFILAAFVFFTIGGLLAMLIRVQIATSQTAFLDTALYNQIFTMHGTVMMFLFAIPMFEGFAIYLLPKLLGARDMAFPRMTAYGFWCYVLGGSILIAALLAGVAPDSGWFMYSPLSSSTYSPSINSDVWLLGITFVEISALSAAVEITVSILKLRAPGMSLDRMPIMAWYLLIVALMMLFGFPPLILGSILLELERAADLPFFDPTRGGDPLLWQHLFWLFGHPEVYIIFLPAAGAVSMMVPTFARHELVGYRAIVVSVIAVAFLSFGLWVHHMFAVGIPHLALAFFSAASGLVAIPTAVQIFAWIATLASGRPRWDVPMLYLGGFFFIFVIGGLTGVMLAMVPFNLQVHDTHFVVAHLHYVLIGGFVFPMIAAAYYWLPHFSGRVAIHRLATPAFWLIFGGFNLTFLPMHLTGLLGMPRRIATYPPEAQWDWLNLASSVGGFLTTIGFALFVADVILHWCFGRQAGRNPWRATTLEWATPTPAPSYAFASLPQIEDRADRLDPENIGNHLARGGGYLGFARNGWMETLAVSMVDAKPEHIVVLPKPTFLPLWTGLATFAFVLCLLFKQYLFAILPLLVVIALFLGWARNTGARTDTGMLSAGNGLSLIPHWEAERPPSWWATVFTLAADATLFASLLFGGLFLWLVAPGWPPVDVPDLRWTWLTCAALTTVGAALAGRLALSGLRRNKGTALPLIAAGLLHIASIALVTTLAWSLGDPTRHSLHAVLVALFGYVVFHSAIGAIFTFYGVWRLCAGYLSQTRCLDMRIGRLWHDYTALSALAGLGMAKFLTFIAEQPL